MHRIRDWNELTSGQQAQTAALDLADHDPPLGPASIERLRHWGYPFAPYAPLFATEGERVCARVSVERRTLTTEHGPEIVTGIAGVVTRPECTGQGLATKLLEEAHRRERAAGLRWSFLWTRLSWRAHGVYERLGYRDVYLSPAALRPVRPNRPVRLPSGYRTRRATLRDVRPLEELLARSRRGRLGFLPRSPGFFSVGARTGWRPIAQHRLLLRGPDRVGYFYASESPLHLACSEAVACTPPDRAALVAALDLAAKGRDVGILRTTFVRDAQSQLVRARYGFVPQGHTTLMARSLSRDRPARVDAIRDLCADRRFDLHSGDMF